MAALRSCQAAPAGAAGLDDPAAQWLPRTDGAAWVYQWSNSAFSPAAHGALHDVGALGHRLPRRAGRSSGCAPDESPATGFADFRHTDAGLVNLNFQSTPAPPQFPVLCASRDRAAATALAGSLFLTLWGTRSPVLAEPLVKGTTWNSIGGANNDVTAGNTLPRA